VGPRTVLDAMVKIKIPSPRRESNPRTPIVQPVAQTYNGVTRSREKVVLCAWAWCLHFIEMWHAVKWVQITRRKFLFIYNQFVVEVSKYLYLWYFNSPFLSSRIRPIFQQVSSEFKDVTTTDEFCNNICLKNRSRGWCFCHILFSHSKRQTQDLQSVQLNRLVFSLSGPPIFV